MTNKEAIDILFTEWKCVDRNDGIHCDRKCEDCDLVLPVEHIRDAYNLAIAALENKADKNLNDRYGYIGIETLLDFCGNSKDHAVTPNDFMRMKRVRLPSVQPERKKGMWYKPTGMMPPEYIGVYRCSVCEEIAPRDWKRHIQILTNFCPNCGADMRGE